MRWGTLTEAWYSVILCLWEINYTLNITGRSTLSSMPSRGFVEIQPGHQLSWPPHSADALLSTRHANKEFEFGDVWPRIGGLSGIESMNLVILSLKVDRSEMVLKWYGIEFQSFGPKTANELSYMDWWAALLVLFTLGILACMPNLDLYTNCILMSLFVWPLSIFHICSIIYRSLRRWRDISESCWRRSQ